MKKDQSKGESYIAFTLAPAILLIFFSSFAGLTFLDSTAVASHASDPGLIDPVFGEVINISKADHLDENRAFISDIYDEVKELDDVWSEVIPADHYVRVTFKKNLTSENDITIYPRTVSGSPRINVYEKDGTELVAEFADLIDYDYNKAFLTGLQGEQDTFDLKILDGSVQFDHIFDPIGIETGDISTYDGGGAACDPCTFSHTIPAGSNRLLIVGVSYEDGSQAVSSITYGATSMTLIAQENGGGTRPGAAAYYLVNPTVGTANVVVDFASDNKLYAGAISFTGVDQSTPVDGATTASADTGSPSISVTSATGDLVMDVVGTLSSSISAGAGQTERWNGDMGGSGKYGGASTEAGAASVTMSWTVGEKHSIVGFNINAATGTTCIVSLNDTSMIFGSVSPGTDTGATNQVVNITNTGTGAALNTTIHGTQWSDGGVNNFVVGSTEWSTSGFSYGAGTDLTTSPVAIAGGNLASGAKITTYYGVGVPGGQAAATYNQTMTITMNC